MKVMVLFSGGLDSTVLAHDCVRKFGKDNVILLNMYYGQKHMIETECASTIAKQLGCSLVEKNLSSVYKGMECALLQGSEQVIENTTYEEQIKKSETGIINTYVPFRNGVFISIATAIAYGAGCSKVFIAVHQDDSGEAYPDCSPEFINAMTMATYYGTGGEDGVIVEAPFVNMKKRDIVARGLEIGMTQEDFDASHSCYNGVKGGCGKCSTCRDRAEALHANGLYDHGR